MNVTPVSNIERGQWSAINIRNKVDHGVYICSCLVISEEYMWNTKHLFVYDIHFKLFHKKRSWGSHL